MSFFKKIFGSNNSERETGGKPEQVSTEAIPQKQYEEDLLITEKPTTTEKVNQKNIVDFDNYKKQQEIMERKIDKIKILYDFFQTQKKQGITNPFSLGDLAVKEEKTIEDEDKIINRLNLFDASKAIINKKDQEKLFEMAEIPEEDRKDLAEVASHIILMSKVKTREKLRHLG